jgi:hypothetical protein
MYILLASYTAHFGVMGVCKDMKQACSVFLWQAILDEYNKIVAQERNR